MLEVISVIKRILALAIVLVMWLTFSACTNSASPSSSTAPSSQSESVPPPSSSNAPSSKVTPPPQPEKTPPQSSSIVPSSSETSSSKPEEIALSSSSSPSSSEPPLPESSSSQPASSEPANSEPEPPEPPEQLIFSTYESFLELRRVLEKSDSEIQDYLEQNSYDMNGLTTREDIESLFAQLSATLLPVLSNANPSGITIFPRSNVVTILYRYPDDVTYDFTVAMDYAFSSERIKAMNENGLLLNEGKDLLMEQGNPIEGIAIYGFVSSENDIEYSRQNFVMDVQGTQITVTVFRASGIDAALAGMTAFEYKLNAFAE